MKEMKQLKIKFNRCIYSTSIEYGDFRVKDDIKEDIRLAPTMQKSIDETILETQFYSTIASGATTIGSAERAPDEIIAKLCRVEV
jgi:hypothetical protein